MVDVHDAPPGCSRLEEVAPDPVDTDRVFLRCGERTSSSVMQYDPSTGETVFILGTGDTEPGVWISSLGVFTG